MRTLRLMAWMIGGLAALWEVGAVMAQPAASSQNVATENADADQKAAPLNAVEEDDAQDRPLRTFYVEVLAHSSRPGAGLGSYRSHGSVSGSSGARLGLGVSRGEQTLDIDIVLTEKSKRFLAIVSVRRETESEPLIANQRLDLSDLRPQWIELAKDEDGRVYTLQLVPQVVEHPRPRPFDPRGFRLENLSFLNSIVLRNDQEYLGELNMSNGAKAWCDIPGVGDIEFSLLPLKGAEPDGVLQGGTLTLIHGKEMLRISNVRNGGHQQLLEGGPYVVWVRWKEPALTLEQARQAFRNQVSAMLEQADRGASTLPDETLERLRSMSLEKPPRIISSGCGVVQPHELDASRMPR